MYTRLNDGFVVHTCGVCGMGFLRKDVLMLHTATPDLRDPRTRIPPDAARYKHFETHDGQPWGHAVIGTGARLHWYSDGADGPSHAISEPVTVLEVAESKRCPGEWFVLLVGLAGERWHSLEDVVQACFPARRGTHRSDPIGVLNVARLEGGKVVRARDELLGSDEG